MVQVVWVQTALNELAAMWGPASSPVRQAITAAADQIDDDVGANPQVGESRSGNVRVYFVHPLGIAFEWDSEAAVARVLHVWDIRRKKT